VHQDAAKPLWGACSARAQRWQYPGAGPTELQRAQHIAERKRVWESLYPQTKHGGTPGAGRGKKKQAPHKEDKMSPLWEDHDTNGEAPKPPKPVKAFNKETALEAFAQANA